jgi:hypothetical protein
MAFITTFLRLIFICTWPNSIFGIQTVRSLGLTMSNGPTAQSGEPLASGCAINDLLGKRTRKPTLTRKKFATLLNRLRRELDTYGP